MNDILAFIHIKKTGGISLQSVSTINKWEQSPVKIDIPDRIKKLAEKFGYS